MKRIVKNSLALLGGVLIAACTNTHLVATWANPEADKTAQNQILITGITDRADYQITFENAIQEALNRKKVTSKKGYDYFGPDHKPSKEELVKSVEKMKAEGIQSVLTISLLDVTEQTKYVPGTTYSPYGYYGGWGGYYYNSYYMVNEPGYYTTTTQFFLEARLYDLNQNKLIWAGQSETTDPSSADSFSREYAAVITEELDRLGLLQKEK